MRNHTMHNHTEPPRRPQSESSESPVTVPSAVPSAVPVTVPVVALVTALLMQCIQSLVMQVRGAKSGVGLTDVLMQWDSQWMTLISRYGYSGFALGRAGSPGGEPIEWQSVAFFPGYPWLVRAVALPVRVLTGAEITVGAAFLVSVVASVAMVWGLGRVSVDILWPRLTGSPPGDVMTGVLTAAAGVLALGAPMSVVYFMAYSESLFTALAVWTVYLVVRRRYLGAGILTCLAGLTRITAVVLVLTLVVAALVELWTRWRPAPAEERGDAGQRHPRRVVAACLAPVVGVLGIACYIHWANGRAAGVGGYFAAQERGWHSGFDFGAATWTWLTTTPLDPGADGAPGTMPGYAISSWSMILVAVLCLASLWPLVTRRLPWQLWLPAVAVAGMTLGSDGIMHSRPRLLLMSVLFLLLPLVVAGVARIAGVARSAGNGRRPRGRRWAAAPAVGVAAGVAVGWSVLGFWVSGEMLIGFTYAI